MNDARCLGVQFADLLPLCTFMSFVVDEVQMLEPRGTQRYTKNVRQTLHVLPAAQSKLILNQRCLRRRSSLFLFELSPPRIQFVRQLLGFVHLGVGT
jgi:hypothetical protein